MPNEKRLIDANALLAELDKFVNPMPDTNGLHFLGGLSTAITEIENAPTVDAEPVVHGRWITHNKGQNNWCECSECNTVGSPFWKRCPVCEAKMDGGNNNG